MAGAKKQAGRKPREDREDIKTALLARISKGELVTSVCDALAVHPATVRKWAAEDEAFGALYARAREDQAHAIAEEALTIADSAAGTSEEVARNRLRVDTRKWLASKIAPKTFGERQAVEHGGAVTVQLQYVEVDD